MTLQFGTATRDITPAYPVWMHGYSGRDHPSDGVLEPLQLGCLAISDGQTTLLIVTCDMIGIHADIAQRLAAHLEDLTGVPADHVLISCSHTHFAPALHIQQYTSPRVGLVGPDPRFVADLQLKMVEAAQESLRNLQPASLETARLAAPQVAFNRRTVRPDGSVQTNFRYPLDADRYTIGPIDTELFALRVRDELGVRAVLANFGCHPVTGGPLGDADHYRLSADYPYYLRQALTAAYGCPAFFTLGGAGDAVPQDRFGRSRQRIGGILGESIVLAERRFAADERATLRAEVVALEAETILRTGPAAEAEYEAAREAFLALLDAEANPREESYVKANERYQLASNALFRHQLYPDNRFAIPVQFLQIGETMLVGLPFEVLSEFARKMKAAHPHSVLCSCAGGYQGYLPFAYEYARGGYEASSASTHFAPGAADGLLELVLAKLDEWEAL